MADENDGNGDDVEDAEERNRGQGGKVEDSEDDDEEEDEAADEATDAGSDEDSDEDTDERVNKDENEADDADGVEDGEVLASRKRNGPLDFEDRDDNGENFDDNDEGVDRDDPEDVEVADLAETPTGTTRDAFGNEFDATGAILLGSDVECFKGIDLVASDGFGCNDLDECDFVEWCDFGSDFR